MSGIAGYISKNKATKKVIKAMTDRIAHRGLDKEGFFVEDNIALGHRLLETSKNIKGEQPLINKEKDLVLISDSLINNYKELKSELESKKYKFETDLPEEVLLHGYKEWGHELTKHIRGAFAFAIYDIKEDELYLARDGWGVKPIYYYEKDSTFLFASEIKAFLDHPDFDKEFNDEILSEYYEVLSRKKFKLSPILISTVLDVIQEIGKSVEQVHCEIDLPDPKDVVFYEVSLAEESSYLVTGNIKHFPILPSIVTPSEMISIIEGQIE